MNMQDIRNKIDLVDEQIVKLFNERMKLAGEVAQIKKESNIGIENKKREREILTRVAEQSEVNEIYIRMLFSTLFDISSSYQNSLIGYSDSLSDEIRKSLEETPRIFPNKAVIACQGVEGAYSQLACDKLFPCSSIMYFSSFDNVFDAVENGLCEYGILPIENSSYGSVGEVYDLMQRKKFSIVRSLRLQINHVLLGKQGVSPNEITEIVSHEQALGQCSNYLRGLKGVKITACENTASAASYVANSGNKGVAAISSPNCAELYGLSVLSDSIQNSDNNYTRFICISKKLEIYPGSNRISLLVSLNHEPGSLYKLIGKFACLGINLIKLESRPIPGKDFTFMFYFDFNASVEDKDIVSLLSLLSSQNQSFTFLGNYLEG